MQYKTYKKYGPVVTALDSKLMGPMDEFITARSSLLSKDLEKDHNTVFVNQNGKPASYGLCNARH